MKGRKQLWVSADEQMLLQEYRKLRDHVGYKVAPEHHMAMKLFVAFAVPTNNGRWKCDTGCAGASLCSEETELHLENNLCESMVRITDAMVLRTAKADLSDTGLHSIPGTAKEPPSLDQVMEDLGTLAFNTPFDMEANRE